jgi:hypothetical protein
MPEVSKAIVAGRRYVGWIAVPLVLLLAALAVTIYAFAIQAQAKAILNEVSALKVGESSMSEVEALAARHHNAVREKHCDNGECFVAFEVSNTWLYRLKLEPIAKFGASVTIVDGTVDSIAIVLSRETLVFPTFPSAGITEEYRKVPERLKRSVFAPYSFPTPVGKPYLRITLTTEATAVERQHAYAYPLKCLIKPGRGCDLPCDYLPLAWHDWESELEKQGVGFANYYPSRKRCE